MQRIKSVVAALVASIAILGALNLNAQASPSTVETPEANAAVAAPETSAPFDIEAATNEWLAQQSAEDKARSDAYFEGGYWLQLWNFLYTLGVCWLLLGTGLSARMRSLAQRITKRKPIETAIYTVQYVILTMALTFPFSIYQEFFREHQYGLSTQTFGAWIGEYFVILIAEPILLALLLIPLYGVLRRARNWWLWGSLVATGFLAFVILIGPVYLDPLFNTYEPLADGPVRSEVLSMARANGVEVNDVYQFDASRQSTRISANVSGILGTMAIRLNDNLLKRCSLPEIKIVMAHEMAHYLLNHTYKMVAFFGAILLGGGLFIRWGFERVRARWGERWSIEGIGDVAGLPLLVGLLSIYIFAMTPLINNYIRMGEIEADRFALQTAREPDGAAAVALKLGEYRKLDPGPIEEWFFYDHPSGRARIHMAMTWKSEHLDDCK